MWAGLVQRAWSHFWTFDAAIVLLTWLTALAGAAFTYAVQVTAPGKTLRGFLRFCLPPEIYRHPSCRRDVAFVAVSHFLRFPAGVMLTNLAVAESTYSALSAALGPHSQRAEPAWLTGIIMACAVVLQDFMIFLAHVLQHRWRVLWELHKVHHSVEFLIPLSNRRFHPLQAVMDNWFSLLPAGLLLGATSYAFSLPVHDNGLLGVDALFLMNLLSFYHLRYSHVPMRYGWLERHLISPAQHQLHHSREDRHWDRNFGFCFAWWDRMFGTIAYSVPGERFALGLAPDEQRQLDSVAKLFVAPLANILRQALRGGRGRVPPSVPGDSAAGSAPPIALPQMPLARMPVPRLRDAA